MEKKTPKSALKELSEKWKGFGAELLVFDSTPSTNVQGGFEYTCIFIKSATGPKFEGIATGKSKKAAEHAACQKVLDQLETSRDDVTRKFPESNVSLSQIRAKPLSPLVLVPNQVNPNSSLSPLARQPDLYNNGATYVVNSSPKTPNNAKIEPQTTTVSPDDLQLDSYDILNRAIASNPIGELQELCAKRNLATPNYTDVHQWIGPDNVNRFKVKCTVGDGSTMGVATGTKMNAKKIAAYKLLEIIRPSASSPTSFVSPVTIIPRHPPNAIASTSTRVENIQLADPVRSKKTANQSQDKSTGLCKTVTNKIKYYESSLLGQGATAKVFQGYFEDRPAAVKVCRKEVAYHEKNEELNILRRLTNPNVVTYYITEDVGELTYIVMELALSTLEYQIESKAFYTLLQLQTWATHMTNGLAALHHYKIVHRDIKPSNVLIFSGDVAKLSDFGISKELDSNTQGAVTEAGKGTRIWMPPEGLQSVGSRVPFTLLPNFDIFSLGLTIFYTMTQGKHLFAYKEDEVFLQIQSNIISYRPNWAWLVGVEWTALKNLLEAMTHVEPNKRPKASVVLEHPFFWNDKKNLEFINSVNNDFKNNSKSSEFSEGRTEMVRMYDSFCNANKDVNLRNWKKRLCTDVQNFMTFKDEMRKTKQSLQTKKYMETSFLKLVEFIRDYHQHYEDWKLFEDGILLGDDIFGEKGSKYEHYFFRKFPELTTVLYTFFQQEKYRDLQISKFYNLNKGECFPKW